MSSREGLLPGQILGVQYQDVALQRLVTEEAEQLASAFKDGVTEFVFPDGTLRFPVVEDTEPGALIEIGKRSLAAQIAEHKAQALRDDYQGSCQQLQESLRSHHRRRVRIEAVHEGTHPITGLTLDGASSKSVDNVEGYVSPFRSSPSEGTLEVHIGRRFVGLQLIRAYVAKVVNNEAEPQVTITFLD
jgi:hypothetical protein